MLISLMEHLKPSKTLARPHKGTVVDVLDPDKLGRVKCTVPGLFEAGNEDLPWIMPFLISPLNFDAPKVGAELMIEFKYGDVYTPFYTGYWHSTANHDEYFDDDYPTTFGLKKDNIKWKFNDTTKKGEIVHISEKNIELLEDGSVNITLHNLVSIYESIVNTVNTDITETIGNDYTQDVGNDAARMVGNNVDETIGNDITQNIGNNVTREIVNDAIDNIGNNLLLTLKKIKIQNDTAEVITLLIEMATALAAEPFIINKGTFSTISTKLTSFKV